MFENRHSSSSSNNKGVEFQNLGLSYNDIDTSYKEENNSKIDEDLEEEEEK